MSRPTNCPAAEVAAVCDWAHRHGRNLPEEVAAHFRITIRQARDVIKARRRYGAPIPFVAPHKAGTTPPRPAPLLPVEAAGLACDCGETFPLKVGALIAHTLTEHGRPPYRFERIPKEIAA